MGNQFLRYVLTFLLLTALTLLSACAQQESAQLQGSTMGTTYSIVVPKLPDGVSAGEIQEDATRLLQRVNQQMSTYIPDSELSLLNKNTSLDWVALSKDLLAVLRLAQSVSEQSGGAFDVTVGPLVNLWGFGPQGRIEAQPSEQAIMEAKGRSGFGKIELSDQRIKRHDATLYIDLSAIAKGYGVDLLAEHLESLGIQDYLVEIGGEIRAKGVSARGDAWRVAVEKPLLEQRSVDRVVNLTNIAVATSGDYRNFFIENGVRYSHTIDPRTGRPISHALASVTVLHESAALADAWATALMVLGEKSGYELAQKLELPAYFLVSDGEAYSSLETTMFARFAAPSP